jgi:hypothetical protein
MPDVLDRTDGLLRLTDGTNTYDHHPVAGDGAIEDLAETITYLHRGKIITDGSGVRLTDETPAEVTFTAMVSSDEVADGVNLPSFIEWMRGGISSAITTATWAATQTRRDGHRPLHVQWYPNPTLAAGVPAPTTGDVYFEIPDALLVAAPKTEGQPTVFSLTFRSTSAPRPTKNVV